jgi:hypothetical protein
MPLLQRFGTHDRTRTDHALHSEGEGKHASAAREWPLKKIQPKFYFCTEKVTAGLLFICWIFVGSIGKRLILIQVCRISCFLQQTMYSHVVKHALTTGRKIPEIPMAAERHIENTALKLQSLQ